MAMDDVFAPLPPEGQQGASQQQQPAEGQGQQPQPQGGEGGSQPGGEAGGGSEGAGPPPAPGADPASRHVPLEALEAERKVRQDWKEKAIRAEAERDQLRQQMERRGQQQPPQGGQPQQPDDPVQRQMNRLENVVLNTSERAARRDHGSETVDKAWARVQQEFQQNPALYQQIIGAPDPWDQVVQHGKRLMAMDEIGTDPLAFRKKVEEEVRAQLAAAAGGAAPPGSDPAGKPAPRLPESLAGARSAGARGTTWTGPAPFDSLFPN
jgi:hypothetical protein